MHTAEKKKKNTPFTEQSEYIYTRTHSHIRPMKKGILQPSLLLIKGALKYIKTYIYSNSGHETMNESDKNTPID